MLIKISKLTSRERRNDLEIEINSNVIRLQFSTISAEIRLASRKQQNAGTDIDVGTLIRLASRKQQNAKNCLLQKSSKRKQSHIRLVK